MAAHAKHHPIPAADGMLTGTPRLLYGWSVRESAGSAAVATFLIRNGSASGDIVAAVELLADYSQTVSFAHPVYVPDGIYIDRVAGTIEGSIFAS